MERRHEMATAIERQTNEQGAGATRKYLTFALGEEEYGLEIMKVREIIGLMDITRVPRMPEFVRGVINLRGKVIPVLDLRMKFNMDKAEDTDQTCIIVVDIESTLMGVVVDEVSEVMNISEEDIEETPEFGARVNTEFILGIGKAPGRVVILLNIVKALSAEEIIAISEIRNTKQTSA